MATKKRATAGLSPGTFRRLRFDDTTRRLLHEKFSAALRERYEAAKPRLSDEHNERLLRRESRCFIDGLEFLASTANMLPAPDDQKRRREKIRAMATHIEGCVRYIGEMDEAALRHALQRGIAEAAKDDVFSAEARELAGSPEAATALCLLAYDLQHDAAGALARFAAGFRAAAADLAAIDAETFPERTARWIEDRLTDHRIKFATSNTGLAGYAFLETMRLATGNEDGTANYQLAKAAKRPESRRAFLEENAARLIEFLEKRR